MYYYEVFVAETTYQKDAPLTYGSEERLANGTIVLAPYRNKSVPGFVAREVTKPDFKVKTVQAVPDISTLPSPIRQLHTWLCDYYPSGSGAITRLFLTSIKKPRKPQQQPAAPAGTPSTDSLPALTKQQSEALTQLRESNQKAFLLHGETGSGKTRVYIEAAADAFVKKQSSLILTPEISLVPQLSETFKSVFGDSVITLHSGLTDAQRAKNWRTIIQSKDPLIVIGTRSAIFAPLNSLGIIVVDEMHEPAYKQESAPRYHALRAAGKLAQLHGARIIYGSATPAVTEYYYAAQKKLPVLRLTETAKQTQEVRRSIIDLRDKSVFGAHPYISDAALSAIKKRLQSREQSLLFLNRRGTARQILCKACGWQATCPKCDLPMTLHADSHTIRCHVCGHTGKPPYSCPECQASDIMYRSLGTKALVSSLQTLFPEVIIRRFDTDNLAADTLSKQYESIKAGGADILVGTQMLGKGLDLPKLSLVVMINADTSLHMPDFSSNERSYQLLHQTLGRVGRGHLQNSEVIVQTYRPEDPLLAAALSQDWQALYDHEIQERQQFMFPPFCFLLKISASRRTSASAEAYMQKMHRHIAAQKLPIEAQQPTPSFYERSHGKFNWQIIVKAKQRTYLTQLINSLPAGDYVCDLDPVNLL